MQAQELLETYDKAAIVVKQFYLAHMLESLNDENLPENFKDFVKEQGIDTDTVAVMLTASPRIFFDVFDKNGIIIHIRIMEDSKEVIFSHYISKPLNSEYVPCTTRIEAERNGVEEAFKLLNEKL